MKSMEDATQRLRVLSYCNEATRDLAIRLTPSPAHVEQIYPHEPAYQSFSHNKRYANGFRLHNFTSPRTPWGILDKHHARHALPLCLLHDI